MMLEAQKQPPMYDFGFAPYNTSMTSANLPSIDNLKRKMVNSTSEHVEPTYKYWNPATNDDSSNGSHVQDKTVDQLIGESRDGFLRRLHDPDLRISLASINAFRFLLLFF
jgi:hypothetical protein